MKYTTVFSANNQNSKLCDVFRRRGDSASFLATLLVSGTFSSGTLAYYVSPDAGVTQIPLKDLTGSAITSTANDMVNINLGNGSHLGDQPSIWATITGAGTPTVTVNTYDNR